MNKLKIQAGGFRRKNNAIIHLQDAVFDAVKGIASALGNNFILSGCGTSVVGSVINVAEGYVVINGEIYKVDAHSISFSGGLIFWVTYEEFTTLDPISGVALDPVLYADGVAKNTYAVRKANLIESASAPVGGVPFVDIKVKYGEGFKSMTLINSWTNGGMPLPNPGYIKEGRFVSFQGDISLPVSAPTPNNKPFFTLPEGYRPSQNGMYAAVTGKDFDHDFLDTPGMNPELSWIYVQTNGDCFADGNIAQSGMSISLANVRFKID